MQDARIRSVVEASDSSREAHVGSGEPHRVRVFTRFDGIDHPIRVNVPATSTVAYYELDLPGNVRRLRASGGGDLGGYRYTAFGQTKDDTATLTQPLRWKARWHSTLNGAEVYDVRARQWAPEIGAFLSIDDYEYFIATTTLWAWPPAPDGGAPQCETKCGIDFDLAMRT